MESVLDIAVELERLREEWRVLKRKADVAETEYGQALVKAHYLQPGDVFEGRLRSGPISRAIVTKLEYRDAGSGHLFVQVFYREKTKTGWHKREDYTTVRPSSYPKVDPNSPMSAELTALPPSGELRLE
jgi:hypothetical protein